MPDKHLLTEGGHLTPSNANAAGLMVEELITARRNSPSIRVGVFHMEDGRILVAKIKKNSVTFTLEA